MSLEADRDAPMGAADDDKLELDLKFALDAALRMGSRPSATPYLYPPLRTKDIRPLAEGLADADLDGSMTSRDGMVCAFIADRPRTQSQGPAYVNLQDGALLYAGGLGCGKTTSLLTTAASFVAWNANCSVVLVDGSDGALTSGADGRKPPRETLGPLLDGALHVDGQSAFDVTLCVDRLYDLLTRRRREEEESSPVLLVIDDVAHLQDILARSRAAAWLEKLSSLIAAGRNFDIYTVLSARRLSELELALRSSVRTVVSLGLAGDDAVSESKVSESAGRGLDKFDDEIQTYWPFDHGTLRTNSSTLKDFGQLEDNLPSPDDLAMLPHETGAHVPIGIDVTRHERQFVDIGLRHLLVVGPPKSGKTTTIVQIARLVSAHAGLPTLWLTGKNQGLPPAAIGLSIQEIEAAGEELSSSMTDVLRQFTERIFPPSELAERAHINDRPVLFVDDAHLLRREKEVVRLLEFIVERDLMTVIMTTDVGASSQYDWKTLKDQSGQVLFLQPSITTDINDGGRVIGDDLRPRPGSSFSPFTGVLYDRRLQTQLHMFVEPRPPRDA